MIVIACNEYRFRNLVPRLVETIIVLREDWTAGSLFGMDCAQGVWIVEGEFVRSSPDDWAVLLVQPVEGHGQVSGDMVIDVGEPATGEGWWSGKVGQWMPEQVVEGIDGIINAREDEDG